MPTKIEQQLQAGIEHHRAGRLRDAENVYRSILADEPEQALSLIHISEPTRLGMLSRMPSSA